MTLAHRVTEIKNKANDFRLSYVNRYRCPGKEIYWLNLCERGEEIHAHFQTLVKELFENPLALDKVTIIDVFLASAEHLYRLTHYSFYYFKIRGDNHTPNDQYAILIKMHDYCYRSIQALSIAYQNLSEGEQHAMDNVVTEYHQYYDILSTELTILNRTLRRSRSSNENLVNLSSNPFSSTLFHSAKIDNHRPVTMKDITNQVNQITGSRQINRANP